MQIELWCFFTFCNANANFALAHRLGNLSGARENHRKLCFGYWSGQTWLFFTLKTANSSLTDHYNVLELVQYLSFRLGILTSLTDSQKYKLHQLLGQRNFWFWEKVVLTKNRVN